MAQCCWSPDWSFLDNGVLYRGWTRNTGGWVDMRVRARTELVTIFSAPPFFLTSDNSPNFTRAWSSMLTAFGQFLLGPVGRLGFSHYGDEQTLAAFRSELAGRSGSLHPVVVMAMPDEFFDSSNEGIMRRNEYLGKWRVPENIPGGIISERDTYPEISAKAVRYGREILEDDPRDLSSNAHLVEAQTIGVWFDSLATQGGASSLLTTWLSNHGGLLRTELSVEWGPIDFGTYLVPILFLTYSDYRRSVVDFRLVGDEVDFIPRIRAASPSPLWRFADVDMTIEDMLTRQYNPSLSDLVLRIYINNETFLISKNPNVFELVLQFDPDAVPPTLEDFADERLQVGRQLFRKLRFIPVQEWAPPNAFKPQLEGG